TYLVTKVWTSSLTEDSPISEAITFQSKEGVSLIANVGIEYFIIQEDVIDIIKTYNAGHDEISNRILYNLVRDAFTQCGSAMNAHEIAGEQKVEFTKKVKMYVIESAQAKKIQVQDLYIIDKFVVPENIEDAINQKAIAKQNAEKIENELRAIYATARKDSVAAVGKATALLINANAEANANKIISNSITPTLVNYNTVERWDGKLPNATSGIPLLNLK
ncbi:MAG: SPFH domain-containing protein, partial [Bacteroidales bacterium]